MKIKGWKKTRTDSQYSVWQNDTTKWNLIVAKSSSDGWICSSSAGMLHDTRKEAEKCAIIFMKNRPRG